MPGQAAWYRTRVLKLLDGALANIKVADMVADSRPPEERARPLLPAPFRRKVSALVLEMDKQVAAIKAEEVQ